MAEFLDVMKQAARMCVTVNNCDQCELMTDAGCRFDIFSDDAKYSIEIERIVMNWAAEHPEPMYPTWTEWQKVNFPNASVKISPCAFVDGKSIGCDRHACDSCRDFPIPADIAEKLGIKPIGGE